MVGDGVNRKSKWFQLQYYCRCDGTTFSFWESEQTRRKIRKEREMEGLAEKGKEDEGDAGRVDYSLSGEVYYMER